MTTSPSSQERKILHTEGDFVIVLEGLQNQGDALKGVIGYRLLNTRTWVCEGEYLQEAMAIAILRESAGQLTMILDNPEGKQD
jgi:hypothetical protein